MSQKVGYIRTSKKDQNPDLQRRELEAAGCEKIYEEKTSSREQDRPQLRAALDYCRAGDTLVVWKLDRLARSLKALIELVNTLEERGVEFRSVRESLDTTTPGGKLVFHVFGSVAEFERDIIRERTMAGLEAARARGRKGGRKPALDDKQVELAKRMLKDPETTVGEVARTFGVSEATIYRHVGAVRPVREHGGRCGEGAGNTRAARHPVPTPGRTQSRDIRIRTRRWRQTQVFFEHVHLHGGPVPVRR